MDYESQWRLIAVWLSTFFKIFPLCSAEERILTGLEQFEGENLFFIFKYLFL